MKSIRGVLLSVSLLAIPGTGAAQFTGHLSIGIGLAAQTHPVPWAGAAVSLVHQPVRDSGYPVVGFSAVAGASDYYDDYGYGHHDGWDPWDPWDCWYYASYDPWFGCPSYYPPGYFGLWWGWHRPVWGFFGFFGWPSYRVVHHHWYGFSAWHAGWTWYPDYYGWGRDRYRYRLPVRYVHDPYDGGGYATPRGYRTGGRATPRGYTGDRIVRGSPLFGPRYKEEPRRARVTDNNRRTGTRGTTDDARRARPRDDTRTTGIRPGTRTGTRTDVPTTRRTPTRTAKPKTTRATPPRVRVRPATTRAPVPKARPGSSSRTPPRVRPAPSKRPSSRPKASAPRRSAPKPKASAPKRPPSRPKASAQKRSAPKPKASPPKRPPSRPKASAPKRSGPKPKARPPSRRSGNSKPPPRRGGKD